VVFWRALVARKEETLAVTITTISMTAEQARESTRADGFWVLSAPVDSPTNLLLRDDGHDVKARTTRQAL
jgi:hypothetical protein